MKNEWTVDQEITNENKEMEMKGEFSEEALEEALTASSLGL